MMGTSHKLNAKENTTVMAFLMTENLKTATERGFKGILGVNTNLSARSMMENIFGFTPLSETQINQYVDKYGNQPFAASPESHKAFVMYKKFK